MKYKLNFFRKRVFPGRGVLLVNDQSYWVFLTFEEYKKFMLGSIDNELFDKLEKNFMVITEDNEDKLVEAQKKLYWHIGSGTSLHIINVTSRCNMNCDYCYANRVAPTLKNFDMTKETAEKVVNFIFQSPADYLMIEFIGGEPLMNFDIIKFVVEKALDKAKETGKHVGFSMTTNATNFDEEKAEFFYKIKLAPCFSIDGPEWLHNKHRVYFGGRRGTYKDVVKWIKYFKEKYPLLPITGISTITRDSLPYYKEIIDEYVKLDLPRFPIRPTTQVKAAGVNWKNLGYSVDEFITFWENALNYLLELNEKKGIRIIDTNTMVYAFYILAHQNIGMTDMEVPCGAIYGQMVYNFNGDIYPCDESRSYGVFKLGSVYKNSFKDIVSSKKAALLFNAATNLSSIADAKPYPFVNYCFVNTYATQGTIVPKLSEDNIYNIHYKMVDRLFERILFEKGFKERFVDWLSPDMSKKENLVRFGSDLLSLKDSIEEN